ncbi:MAG TPA: glycoside hydrolase family 1 protein, partial [Mycobacterium sp.]|nr:glycoside hydrolase family 1 protein [Mycobacterium sp.]
MAAVEPSGTTAPDNKIDAVEVKVDTDAKPSDTTNARASANSFVAQTLSSTAQVQTAAVTAAVTPPTVPSLRPWPTAFDPLTAVTYVTGLVSSFVSAILSPFAAGPPAPPVGPPTLWTLLAWVRREFFNESPTINYNLLQNTQSVVDGDVVIKGN